MSTAENVQPGQPGSQPGEQNSEGQGETVTMTKAELQALIDGKLKGSGKELKKLQEQLAGYKTVAEQAAAKAEEERKAKLAEEGKYSELLAAERAEKEAFAKQQKELAEKLKTYEQREAARRAALAERNAARIKELPKELQSIIPQQLDEEAMDAHLGNLEKLIVNKSQPIFSSGGVGRQRGPEDVFKKAEKVADDFLFGKKGK